MKEHLTRRSFLEKSALTGAGMAFGFPAFSSDLLDGNKGKSELEINVFSKHLQFLNYKDLAQAAAEIGFNGIDLSVRPKGHVLPERVKDDLPLAIEQMKSVGFKPGMMTTAVNDVNAQYSKEVLETGAKLGIKHYRLGYHKYNNDAPILEVIEGLRKKMHDLSLFNEKLGIWGAYQNHAGSRIGAVIWEIWEMLKDVGNDYLGCQYDIRHATVEGGKSWSTGLKLIKPKIKTIVLKDFKWHLKSGKWDLLNTPIGEGMVDFKAYFKLLKQLNIKVPVSMHYEYDLGGAEHGKREISISQKEVFQAMKKDLQKVRELWEMA